MKNNLLLLISFTFAITSFSQISFEKGYFIDNADQKIECLIKNMDWKSNPDNFDYKMTSDGPSENMNINNVKEFGIHMTSKYVRHTVKMDRSSENLNQLTQDKTPLFKEEEHFLRVLIEGDATLYSYEESNLKRYFFAIENSKVEPLVFKKFLTADDQVGTNNEFKQQLWTSLKCPSFKINKMTNLQYKKNSLMNLFMDYNKCTSSEFVNYEEKEKQDLFNITLRPRFNSASLSIQNSMTPKRNTDFGKKSGFSFGVDFEYIFPFNKNKWSISLEPNYQSFKSEKIIEVNSFFDKELLAVIDYKSIDVPLSIRHYFFLNKDSKIYASASYVFSVNSSSNIEFQREDGSILNELDITSRNNFALGIGYKYKDKYSIEARYLTPRKVLDQVYWTSNFESNQAFS